MIERKVSFRIVNRCDKCGKPLSKTEGVFVYYFSNDFQKRLCWQCWEEFCLRFIKHALTAEISVDRDGKIHVDFRLKGVDER